MLMRDIRKYCYICSTRDCCYERLMREYSYLGAVTKLTADVGALLTVADDGKLMGLMRQPCYHTW